VTILNKTVLNLHGNEHVVFALHQNDMADAIKEPLCSYCDECDYTKELVHYVLAYLC
jgi:hypothetical protein